VKLNCARIAILGMLLAISPGCLAGAAETPASGAAEQERSAQAVQAYVAKQKAEQEKAVDQIVANRMRSLLEDPGTQILGNPAGDVTIVEFFDYTCPFCKAVEPRLQQLLKDDRNVRLVVKQFPILRPESLIAAKAALASANQGKFPIFHRMMMEFRGQLTGEAIFDMARSSGLDVARLRQDMNAPAIADAIIASFNLARTLRVTDTPSFIIGPHRVTESSANIDFPKAVRDLRATRAN
jgi:protein-disulfide isomerase